MCVATTLTNGESVAATRARSLHCDPDPAHISDDVRGSCWAWLVKFRCVAKIEAYFFYLVFSGAKVQPSRVSPGRKTKSPGRGNTRIVSNGMRLIATLSCDGRTHGIQRALREGAYSAFLTFAGGAFASAV